MFADGSAPFGGASRWVCMAALLGFVSAGFGCSALSDCDTSNDGNPPDPYYAGTTIDGFYMSSDWTGPLLPFTGGKQYKFYHGLGCTPRDWDCVVSFSAEGVQGGSIASPAGNMCVILDINDEYIWIKNDTCSEMYVMMTAAAPSNCAQDAGATDAGVEDSGGD